MALRGYSGLSHQRTNTIGAVAEEHLKRHVAQLLEEPGLEAVQEHRRAGECVS
jgi:hypothetical protein